MTYRFLNLIYSLKIIELSVVILMFSGMKMQAQTHKDTVYFKTGENRLLKRTEFIKSIDSAQQIINMVQTESKIDWRLKLISSEFKSNRKTLFTLRSIFSSKIPVNYRNLTLYTNILKEIDQRNVNNKNLCEKQENALKKLKAEMEIIPRSPNIQKMIAMSDSTAGKGRNTKKPLNMLNSKWERVYQTVSTNLDSVTLWNSQASINRIISQDLMRTSDSLTRISWTRLIKGRSGGGNLRNKMQRSEIQKEIQERSDEEKEILLFYLKENSGLMIALPIFLILIMGSWIILNIRRIKKQSTELFNSSNFLLLSEIKWIVPIILIFNIVIIFDVHAPWNYLLTVQITLALLSAWIFWKNRQKKITYYFLTYIALFLIISMLENMRPSTMQKYSTTVAGLAVFAVTVLIFRKIKSVKIQLNKFIVFVLQLSMFLSILAVGFSFFNGTKLSLMLINTAIIAVFQIVSLAFFKQLITETLLLELISNRLKIGVHQSYDFNILNKNLHLPMILIVSILWITMFLGNLNIYDIIYSAVADFINHPIKIGSLSFSFGGILLFLIIVWIANLLQRYIGYFFGDVDSADENKEFKKQRSRMMATKLIIICLGYILAIGASGLPLDKITIVIGALGIGVGMGLQNIVNNFISGIILIFDRPLQLGDTIEVKGYSGKVKNMGIRASTLLTSDGAEVIIPNGDLLSNSIVNWTLTNNQKRVNLDFQLQTDAEQEKIREMVYDILKKSDLINHSKQPIILFASVHDANIVGIKIFFWCSNVDKTEWTKSEIRFALYKVFRENDIVVMSTSASSSYTINV